MTPEQGIASEHVVPAETNHLSEKVVLRAEDLAFGRRRVSSSRIPRHIVSKNYDEDVVAERQNWLSEKTDGSFPALFSGPKDFNNVKTAVENPIGWCAVPVGVVGPISIKRNGTVDLHYVPFATTQGTMIASYQQGASVIFDAGGAQVLVTKDQIDIDPVFVFDDIVDAHRFYQYVESLDLDDLNKIVATTSRYAKLLLVQPNQVGNYVLVRCVYTCGEAMGLNMITIANHAIIQDIMTAFPNGKCYPRSNYTSDKKSSAINLINSYGKEVVAEITIHEDILKRHLRIACADFEQVWKACLIGTSQGGGHGHNAQVANAAAAIFLATGQDIAQVANACTAFTYCELVPGGIRISLKFHSLPVATIGGGTIVPAQNDALKMLGCTGSGSAIKLAEIIGVTALAGEISLIGTIASNSHAKADLRLRSR